MSQIDNRKDCLYKAGLALQRAENLVDAAHAPNAYTRRGRRCADSLLAQAEAQRYNAMAWQDLAGMIGDATETL